jgi:exoribonuclease-2
MGRNREAQLPVDRVILATGVATPGDEAVEEFRKQSEELAADVNLSEVWDVVRDESSSLTLDELAELYWGPGIVPTQKAALCLYLERTPLYFTSDEAGYSPRSRDAVEDLLTRSRRAEENARDSAVLVDGLSQGFLPAEVSDHQRTLLNHLRQYVVHGDNYTRSAVAQGLLGQLESGTRDLQRLAFDILVETGVLSANEPLEIERAGIVEAFPEAAVAEAAGIDPQQVLEAPNRRDLTGLDAVTIDDEDTKDRDDALSLEVLEGPDGPDAVYRLGIHIADAGALIPSGGALDQEADRRMATLYMPDRKVSMLPPEISSGTGSLAPGEKRATLSLLIRITGSGEVLDWEVVPSVVRSRAALSYSEADRAIGDAGSPWHQMLATLEGIAGALRRTRGEAGANDIDQPEMVIKIDESGVVDVTVGLRSAPARSMVAELMILYNSLLGEYCRREELPAAYRSQPPPDPSDDAPPVVPPGPALRYVVMRRLQPATVGVVPGAHAGLGVAVYIQATSPLRRYPDLVLQRQVGHYLITGETAYSADEVASVAQRADVQIRELARLEEDRRRYWFLKYLKQRLTSEEGEGDAALFSAVVLDNRPRRPALLELSDYPFRFRAELPESCIQGETVTLQLHGVDLWRRAGQFVHVRADA